MTTESDKAILEAVRLVRAATTDGERQLAQYALDLAIGSSEAPAHQFKTGDWVAHDGHGYQVVTARGGTLLIAAYNQLVEVSADRCLPIPPRPDPKHGWETDGCIVTEPCEAWWNPNGNVCVFAEGNPPIVPIMIYGARRWRAVRAVAVPVPPKPAATFRPFRDHIEARQALGRKVVDDDGNTAIITQVYCSGDAPVMVGDDGRYGFGSLFAEFRYLSDDGTAGDPVGVREGGAE